MIEISEIVHRSDSVGKNKKNNKEQTIRYFNNILRYRNIYQICEMNKQRVKEVKEW